MLAKQILLAHSGKYAEPCFSMLRNSSSTGSQTLGSIGLRLDWKVTNTYTQTTKVQMAMSTTDGSQVQQNNAIANQSQYFQSNLISNAGDVGDGPNRYKNILTCCAQGDKRLCVSLEDFYCFSVNG